MKFWKDEGVDVFGYTTLENVQDLDALRRHLGAEKITLWGISYGSHLALAALKTMDDRIEKVIIASAEGMRGEKVNLKDIVVPLPDFSQY